MCNSLIERIEGFGIGNMIFGKTNDCVGTTNECVET